MKKQNFIKRVFHDKALRLRLSLFGGAIVNLSFIVTNLATVFLYNGNWPLVVAVYYSIIFAIRLHLLSFEEGDSIESRHDAELYVRVGRIGIFMLFLNLMSGAIMLYSFFNGDLSELSGVFVAIYAVYAVYTLIVCVRDIVRSVRRNSPLLFAIRNLTLTTASISIFNLASSITLSLGISEAAARAVCLFLGTAVFSGVIAMSLVLTVRCARLVKRR